MKPTVLLSSSNVNRVHASITVRQYVLQGTRVYRVTANVQKERLQQILGVLVTRTREYFFFSERYERNSIHT